MLSEVLKDHKIILASGSPRRQQFLKELSLSFEVRLKEVEEIYPENLTASEITDFLAELKASALKETLSGNEILITSDTIVWHEGKALGKPADYNQAFEMLSSLSGKTHEVITSVALKSLNKSLIFNEITLVTFNTLLPEEIKYYIENYQPYDKAGAYGIQEWIGLIGIQKIEGSYTNVVGLPVESFYKHLHDFVTKK